MHPGARQGGLSWARCPGLAAAFPIRLNTNPRFQIPEASRDRGVSGIWNASKSGIDLRIGRRCLPSRDFPGVRRCFWLSILGKKPRTKPDPLTPCRRSRLAERDLVAPSALLGV